MSRRRLTTIFAIAGVSAVVLIAAVIGIAASSGGSSSGTITGPEATEAYYETLADLSETGVDIASGLTDAESRSDIGDSARALIDEYEVALDTLEDLRLDDPTREAEREALVSESEPMLNALRDAEEAATTSPVDALIVLVDERDAFRDGVGALADAYRGAAEALRDGDGDAYREALQRLRPALEELADRVGAS
jgi:hypothetical protein